MSLTKREGIDVIDDLTIRSVSFYKSMKLRSQTPVKPRPEIAIAGRSNSGKSSLINYLVGRKNLAYVGKQPGKTRLVNYYVINDDFYLVDLPGYGYARVSKNELTDWGVMMDAFFHESSEYLRGIIICLDIRRDPSVQDMQMIEWAIYYGIDLAVVATKSDKVAKSKRPHNTERIARFIYDHLRKPERVKVYAVSSADRVGADAVLREISHMLAQAGDP